MRRLATVVVLAALFVLSGMPAEAQDTAEEGAYGASVSAIDNVFTPEIVRIEIGDTVEWTMDGRSPHTVDADDGSWTSGNLEPGTEFDHTFDAEGVFPFFCRYHGRPGVGMTGTVVVGDAPLPGVGFPAPTPSRRCRRAPSGSRTTRRRSRRPSTARSRAASS